MEALSWNTWLHRHIKHWTADVYKSNTSKLNPYLQDNTEPLLCIWYTCQRQAAFQKHSHDETQQIQGTRKTVNRPVLNLVLTHWPGT